MAEEQAFSPTAPENTQPPFPRSKGRFVALAATGVVSVAAVGGVTLRRYDAEAVLLVGGLVLIAVVGGIAVVAVPYAISVAVKWLGSLLQRQRLRYRLRRLFPDASPAELALLVTVEETAATVQQVMRRVRCLAGQPPRPWFVTAVDSILAIGMGIGAVGTLLSLFLWFCGGPAWETAGAVGLLVSLATGLAGGLVHLLCKSVG
ncbi:MAG: hypothetical protein AB7F89_05080 [Pirellulaceae bacterium]